MANKITTQKFNNLFVSNMDKILQGLYDVSSKYIFVIMGLCLVLHGISVKKWFDNKVKKKTILKKYSFTD